MKKCKKLVKLNGYSQLLELTFNSFAGSLWGCRVRKGEYGTSFFHFYYEFQSHGGAELELHNSPGKGLKHQAAWIKARLHTYLSKSKPMTMGHLDHIQGEKRELKQFSVA